jgi:hypothetical protein
MMNGQQVWIDDVSRSARPRTLPSVPAWPAITLIVLRIGL